MLQVFGLVITVWLMFFAVMGLPQINASAESEQDMPLLSQNGRAYYAQLFSYVMATQKDETPYEWQTYEASGKISAYEGFKTQKGTLCRPFVESYAVGDIKGSGRGYACKRIGKEGWCKLKEKDVLTCAMEPAARADEVKRDGNEAMEKIGKVTDSIKHWWK